MLKPVAGTGKSAWLMVPPAVMLPMNGPGMLLKFTEGKNLANDLMWLPMTMARRPTNQTITPYPAAKTGAKKWKQ